MSKQSKNTKVALSVCMALVMVLLAIPTTLLALAAESDSIAITQQDAVKMSEAFNLSTDSEVYDIGTNPYRIFDPHNQQFSQLFLSSNVSKNSNISFSGTSRASFSSQYSKERAISASSEISVPISAVSANIDANFETSIKTELNESKVNEEYFEYFERYQQTRVITTNWLSRDLTSYFSDAFISDLDSVTSVKTAIDFLEDYGTHVFNQYFMGGSMIITNYIVSEESITEEYAENNVKIGLSAQISQATATNEEGSSKEIEGNNVSNAQTKSQMNMRSHGGLNFNALTVNDLFTYKQEYATGGGSGFIYVDWIKAVDAGKNEVVIDVAKPVAIWDLLDKSSYYDATRENYFKQAFDIMCYSNFSRLCNENGVNSEMISSVKYNSNGTDVHINLTSGKIKLPANITATFELGKSLIDNENSANIQFELDRAYNYASLNGNQLHIDSSAEGRQIALSLNLHGEKIYTLNINVENNDSASVYANGYGTKDQPYLISTPDEWWAFVTGKDTYKTDKEYYQLANDINLKGRHYEVGGSSERNPFKGVLDGNNHTISNFSIVAKSDWQNIGMFGVSLGTIQNLVIDNAKVINSGVHKAEDKAEINAGILVGLNRGTLDNIQVRNSSVRISANLADKETALNIGALCGTSAGNITYSAVSNCNVYGLTWKAEGSLNVGGMIGKLSLSTMSNCYVRNSAINGLQENKKDGGKHSIGGLIGLVTSKDDIVSKAEYSVVYGNKFNTTANSFGYIAGTSTDKKSFGSCYFGANQDKAVAGASMAGCTRLGKVTLADIGDAEFNRNWTTDANGEVILKKHS